MSIFLDVAHWALIVTAALLCLGAGFTVALAVDAWRTEGRAMAWYFGGLFAVIACFAAGLFVAAGYVR